ncbi:restriction endonuclease [Streptomyces sp. SP18ES09]|uniref:nSTAND3 domain-containing NTPase n=1 Tax=Streptomyces sp. SP18ES09 TaxID=3002532 RepID=UPI002E7681C6|nr:restriction endonuclease [Streptomyces sp. SP18ES09]MEE1815226.1 restriction endonuclease [Streptomyces sp. SP18ES09]
MARNYSDLSPHDFEILVRDLLQASHGVRMETFPPGRDGGVDVRLHRNGEETLIAQCKHSPGRTFAQIKGQLESEAKKIGDRFSCRYILATSASLTRQNKQDIAAMFTGVRLVVDDIWGVDDLDNLLRLHPRVEVDNFKLWITSSAVLGHLLHPDLYRRSSGLVDRIIKRRKLFVHSDAYPDSLRMLKEHHVCVISGEPGIGKTTLAETLLVKFLSDGWEVHSASSDVADIEKVWKPGVRQVFLYDDFLGQNSLLDNLNKNEDSRLANLVERIRDVDDKVLIMTTREYILQQARQVHERLQASRALTDGKVILNLAHYTAKQKARIFYNHIHFAELSDVARESVLRERRYMGVIQHANFNPRIIELVTKNFESSGVEDECFFEYVMNALDDPRELWERIFESQLSAAERSLLLVLATIRTRVELRDLHRALNAYEGVDGGQRTDLHRLRMLLKKLEGTFIQVSVDTALDDQVNGFHPRNRATLIQLANPSFVDYVSSYLSTHPDEINQMAQGCFFFEQAETLALWELGEASHSQIFRMAFDVFFGAAPQGRQLPRLAPGHQTVLMSALTRLGSVESCTWVNSPLYYRVAIRREVSVRNRHLVMLILDHKYGRSLLEEDSLAGIVQMLTERIGQTDLGLVEREFPLMRYLSRYEVVADRLVAARDLAAARMLKVLEHPEHFQSALSVFRDLGINPSRWSERSEADLRQRFSSFASEWDWAEAGRVNNVVECESSLSFLQEALVDFELHESMEPVALADRLSMLQDEVAQDLDFGDEELDESDPGEREREERDEGNVHSSEQPDDPIDDLFQTLI